VVAPMATMKMVARETPNMQSEVLKRLRRRFLRHIRVIRVA